MTTQEKRERQFSWLLILACVLHAVALFAPNLIIALVFETEAITMTIALLAILTINVWRSQ